MARIPESEVERLKRGVSLVRVIEGAGLRLVRQGKDVACRCPFHEGDDTPSLIVTPGSNLFHCFGCDAGGSVIDWVMRFHKVSFRHACELLAQDSPALASGIGRPTAAAAARRVESFALDAGDQALLDQVLGFYHETLKQSADALAYLEKRGLHDPALIARFRLGYANRSLAYRLPPKQVKAGAEQRGALQRIGILRDSGHEHFNGSLVIPILDAEGHATEVYGRKIRDDLRPGTPRHLYLPGPHRGVFNRAGLEGQDEVILCEALIDALTFIAAGYENVTSAFGVTGFTDELLDTLKACGTKRVLIAFDRDEAGERAAAELAPRLQALGLDAYRLLFPKGMDANAYAGQVKPARKSLGVVIRSAVWMGQGQAPARPAPIEPTPAAEPVPAVSPPNLPFLAAAAAEPEAAAIDTAPALPARAVGAAPEPDIAAETTERDTLVTFGERRYRVRGLAKNTSPEVLKVNVLVSSGESPSTSSGQGLHVDTLDLYQAKARQVFARQAAVELGCEDSVIQRDLGKLLLKCEELQDARLRTALTPSVPGPAPMAQADEAAALEFLKSPDLIARITADFERIGLVGEPVNALVGYLAAVSRKLAGPLAIIIQSTSAAGKSAVMDAVLKLVPEEDRVHYSAMTGQSLFYIGEKDLKHKILAIAEEEGVRQAAYALKLLQSQGELTIASTGKDPETGKLVTEEYRVEGPVMLFLTTTAIDIDEELLNRCLVLTINESREQTRAIQSRQRSARTLAGLLAQNQAQALAALHRNAQRLLKPLAVVNPFAEALTFLDERTRTRRDHQKYLTLIDSIALLHQHQRAVKTVEHGGQTIEYLEVTAADIALANRLAHEVLGRSLDELPPQTRRLLGALCTLVESREREQSLRRAEVRFTRSDVRSIAGLSDTQARIHLDRLVQMEYVLVHHGQNGRRFVYELIFDGTPDERQPRLPGLIDVATLETASTTASLRGQDPVLAGDLRAAHGPLSAGSRDGESPGKARPAEVSGDGAPSKPKTAHQRLNGAGHSRSASADSVSFLAAAVEAA